MMFQEQLGIRIWVAAGHDVGHELQHSPAHVRPHLVLGQRRQPMSGANEVDARGNRGVAVNEGAVEIEDDGSKMLRHDDLRLSAAAHGCYRIDWRRYEEDSQ